MRVPLPAARMTMWVSMKGTRGPSRLSRRSRLERAPAIGPGHRRRFKRRAERVVVVERGEIEVVFGERAVFGIQGDGAFEVRHRFGMFAALGVCHREHVERVVV